MCYQFVEIEPMHDELLRKKEEQDREKSQRHLFRFPHVGMWTKLRPGIWNFLEKVIQLVLLYAINLEIHSVQVLIFVVPSTFRLVSYLSFIFTQWGTNCMLRRWLKCLIRKGFYLMEE